MPTKNEEIERTRLAQLRRFAPQVFGTGTLLYVGACPKRAQCLEALIASGRKVTILEVMEAYAAHYARRDDLRVICGDVRRLASLPGVADRYDVIFWWHGPEHVSKPELPGVLAEVEKRAELVVLACPWGRSPQRGTDADPYREHKATLMPGDFEEWGYRVSTLGAAGGRSASNLIAVKAT